ncbi:MAG: restriction endonuclease subunit S [Desulfobacteraceae bacterium]|nr:MAG: restriction endonuclease subunit S [Desulfobacteraceae bacterium]
MIERKQKIARAEDVISKMSEITPVTRRRGEKVGYSHLFRRSSTNMDSPSEGLKNLPSGWEMAHIGDLTLRTKQRNPMCDPGKRFFYIDVSSVSNTSFRITTPSELLGADAPSRARKVIEASDVLFATVRPTLKRVAFVPDNLHDQIASTGFIVLRTDALRLISRYLYYYLLTDEFVQRMSELERGASYPAVRDSDILNEKITFPPLDEQRKIAGVLGVVQRAIEQQERLIALTQELKKALLHKLFTEGLRGEPQKETEIGPVPESWELLSCEELCEMITVGVVVKPASHYVEKGVPAFRSFNVREDCLSPNDLVYFSEVVNDTILAKSKLHAGDVLVVRTGYPGTSCVVSKEYDGANCIDLVIVRPKAGVIRGGFLSRFFNSPMGKSQAVAAKHGLAQQHLNVSAVKRTLVPVPSIEDQDEIDFALATVQQKIALIARKKDVLIALFRTLLHQLMTAKMRVTDLELPESESTYAHACTNKLHRKGRKVTQRG